MGPATSDIAKEADEAGALDLGEYKSPFSEDSAPIAGEPLPTPISQSCVYSFSLKRKADSSHMGSSKKQTHPDLEEDVPRTGNAVSLYVSTLIFFLFAYSDSSWVILSLNFFCDFIAFQSDQLKSY